MAKKIQNIKLSMIIVLILKIVFFLSIYLYVDYNIENNIKHVELSKKIDVFYSDLYKFKNEYLKGVLTLNKYIATGNNSHKEKYLKQVVDIDSLFINLNEKVYEFETSEEILDLKKSMDSVANIYNTIKAEHNLVLEYTDKYYKDPNLNKYLKDSIEKKINTEKIIEFDSKFMKNISKPNSLYQSLFNQIKSKTKYNYFIPFAFVILMILIFYYFSKYRKIINKSTAYLLIKEESVKLSNKLFFMKEEKNAAELMLKDKEIENNTLLKKYNLGLGFGDLGEWQYHVDTEIFEFDHKSAEIAFNSKIEIKISKDHLSEFIDIGTRKKFIDSIDKLVNSNAPFEIISKFVAHGSIRYVKFTALKDIIKDGKIVIIGLLKDVSNNTNNELEIIKVENKLERLNNLIPEISIEIGSDLSITFINNNGYSLFGIDKELFKYDIKLTDLIYKEDLNHFLEHWTASISNKKEFLTSKFNVYTSENRHINCELFCNLLYNEQHQFTNAIGIIIDKSKVKEAEDKLLHKQIILNKTCSIAKIGFFEHNLIENTHYWSREIYAILEISPNSFAPHSSTFLDFVHPDDRNYVSNLYNSVIAQGVYSVNFRGLINGKTKHIQEWGKAEKDSSGNVVLYHGIIHDITEEKEKEMAFQKNQQKLLLAQKIAKLGYIEYSLNGDYFFVSQEIYSILEIEEKDQLFNPSYLNYFIPIQNLNIPFLQYVSESLKTEKHFIENIAIKTINGTTKFLEISGTSERDLISDYEFFLITLQDITEAQINESKLAESEAKFKGIADNALLGIFILKDLKVIYINKYISDLLEYPKEFIFEDQNIFSFIAKEDRKNVLRLFKDLYKGLTSQNNFNANIITKSGKKLVINISIKSTMLNQTETIIGSMIDISDLYNAKIKAEEAEALKTNFLSVISHEIRTPMNSIIGYAQLLSFNYDIIDEEEKLKYIKFIDTNSKSLLYLINDLLDMAQITSGSIELNEDIIYLNEVLLDLYSIYQNELIALGKSDILLGYSFGLPDMVAVIKNDSNRFKQIFKHLLSNAVKFTNSGEIDYGYKLNENDLIFFIKDTGIGIPAEKQSTIFDIFNQEDFSHTRKYGGIGLGLAICKSLVHKMNGRIWLESEVEKGSTFYFSIKYDHDLSDTLSKLQEELYNKFLIE